MATMRTSKAFPTRFARMWQDVYLTYWFLTRVNKSLMILDWAINLYSRLCVWLRTLLSLIRNDTFHIVYF